MTAVFLETSALLRMLFGEERGDSIAERLRNAERAVASRLIRVEAERILTEATQIYHMGCYAAGLLQCAPRNGTRPAEVVHPEFCPLHFNPLDHSPEQLMVQSLFADGHIRYSVIPPEAPQQDRFPGAFELLSVREEIVPDSRDDMTWLLSDWGFRMTLSRDVPGRVAAAMPRFLANLFASAGCDFHYAERAPAEP